MCHEEENLMTEKAFSLWTEKILGAHARRSYLTERSARLFREALGQPLEVEDLNLLVGIDGNEPAICSVCGTEFTPVWWIESFQELLDTIKQLGRVDQALEKLDCKMIHHGSFYPQKNVWMEPLAFCGSPYFFNRKNEVVHTANSHLGMAKRKHPDGWWGRSMPDIERMRNASKKQVEERRKRDEEKIAQMFGVGNVRAANGVRAAHPRVGRGCR